jgi:hypothetical protein
VSEIFAIRNIEKCNCFGNVYVINVGALLFFH